MLTFAIFNTVLYDGIGDFFHFEEILEALLKNERFNGVKFIAFINFHEKGSAKNFARIDNKLNTGLRQQSDRVQVHFGNLDFHKKLRTSPKLQNVLATAVRGVIISNDGAVYGQSLVKCYVDNCRSLLNIPFVYIAEHEIVSPPYPKEGRGVSYDFCALGLYDGLSKYTFLEYANQNYLKENHFYLQREKSGNIVYFLKKTDGATIKGHPDLNAHSGDLNHLSDYVKKEILRSACGMGRIDDDIPMQRVRGIKLKEIPKIESLQAWDIMHLQARTFTTQLLNSTQSIDFDHFMKNNMIIPIYLNQKRHLIRFLSFLSNNILAKKIDNSPKDIVIYLSGCHFPSKKDLLNHLIDLNPKFNHELILSEQLSNDGSLIIIPCDQYTIRIFSGFYLNDAAYDAIYHLTHVAVVSGDNTLERCVSMNILPFYWSSNHCSNKWKTVLALQEITQRPELPLSDEARFSFKLFFSCTQRLATCERSFQYFDGVNFTTIIEEWPIVANFLQKNKNFYAHLEDIMFFRLSPEIVQQCQKQQSIDLLEEHILLNSDELLIDASNATRNLEKSLTTEMVIVSNSVQNLSSEQHDINVEPVSSDFVEDNNLLINQESIKNTPFYDESSVQNQSPRVSNNAQYFESTGGCWQAICAFFNRIYNAIIRILRQWMTHSNYSPQLFQPVHNVHNVAELPETIFSRIECTNSV